MDLHKEVEKDYTVKYEQYRINNSSQEIKNEVLSTVANIEKTDIFKELKAYRLNKSREENIKAYFIYNDNQLKDLISKMPKNKKELQLVAGFGEKKADKYGDDILKILSKFY